MTVRAHLTLYTKTWRLMLQPRQQKHQAVQRGRSLISNVVDIRDPIQIAYDQLAKRAEVILV
jgi:hypothetical protein